MMDYQAFRTKADAQAEMAKMRGWHHPQVTRVFYPSHPLATRSGYVWVIAVSDLYLRADGFVR